MTRRRMIGLSLALLAAFSGQACGMNSTTQPSTPPPESANTSPSAAGSLEIRANGEDFVRQGFTSKDGWKITFDHVHVTLADVTAYQTDPPFDATTNTELTATQQVRLDKPQTVDLAAGDAQALPIVVGTVQAPAGRYNALSWRMIQAEDGVAAGTVLMLVGTATKDGQTVPFTLKFDQELAYQCGEFVGDERKGLVKPGATSDLEATFHFDHLFGDAETAATDELNQKALGFEPFVKLAKSGAVEVTTSDLKQSLPAEDFQKFQAILPSLGHVGEGHCREITLANR